MSRGPPNTQKLLHRDGFTHREAFTHRKLLHIKAFTNSTLSHTASVYTQNTYTQCFYTWQAFTHTETIRNFYTETVLHTEKLLHTASLYTQNLLHTAGFHTQQAFTHRTLTHSAFTHAKRLHTHKLLHTGIAAPKPELDATTVKIRISSFFRRILKGKLLAPKLRKSADKSLSQPGCSHSNTIYDLQLQMTIPEHRILILINILKPVDLHLVFFNCKLLIWNP